MTVDQNYGENFAEREKSYKEWRSKLDDPSKVPAEYDPPEQELSICPECNDRGGDEKN